jgi:hypothetical protein
MRWVAGADSGIIDVVRGLSAEPGLALSVVHTMFEVRPMAFGGVDQRATWEEEKHLQASIRGLAEVYFINRLNPVACGLIAEGVSRYGPTRTTELCVELSVLCGMPRPHQKRFTPYAVVELQWYVPAVLESHHWARAALDVWYRSIVQLVRDTEFDAGECSAGVLAERCSHVLAICGDKKTKKYLASLQRLHRRANTGSALARWRAARASRTSGGRTVKMAGSGRAIPHDIAWIVRFHHAYSMFINGYEPGLVATAQPVEV